MQKQPKSVRAVFDRALEITSPNERRSYLDEACAGDAGLRQEVESLLRAHGQAGDFLGRPAVEQVSAAPPVASDATVALDADAKEGEAGLRSDRPEPTETRAEPGGEDEGTALNFLQPSTKPGSLGRLAHYEVLEVLGKGGFGIVLKAFDEKLHRVVAVKVMAPHLAATSPARKRFLREARASAAIRHENVVAIYAVDDQPIPYLVMEYIAGKTLQDRLDGNGPLDLKEVLRIGRQVADGLAAAHAMGIIHRDVKPANILLENGVDHVKITDFGLARAADDASLSQSGVIAGTPMYMAPEQAMGESLDHRADLFSLGSVLYVMCTGRPPFRASTTFAVLKRVAEDTPRPMREVIPELPEWLCAIVARLHAKKPADRYASAKEVADLLARYLSELQLRGNVSSPPPEPVTPERSEPTREGLVPAPVAPRARRSGRRWMAAAAVFLLLLIGLGVTEVAGVTHLAGAVLRLFHPSGAVPPVQDEPPPLAVAPFDADEARAHQEAWAKHLHVPVEVENSIGMKLRLVPPGEFLMGSSQEEVDAVLKEIGPGVESAIRSEAPPRRVRIAEPFFLGTYEVTVGQFRRFVAATGYRTLTEVSGKGGVHWDGLTGKMVADPQDIWSNPRWAPTDEYPVGVMTYPDTQAFCDWLGAREGVRYVLPDEEQWEYACRAGTTGRWCNGDDPEEARRFGWFDRGDGGTSHPVGRKLPNAFGLFDMHGNAEEWAGSTPGARALRGGQHGSTVWECRSATRIKAWGNLDDDNPWVSTGFRVAVVGDLSKFNPDRPTGTGSRKVLEGPPPPLAVAPLDAPQAKALQEAAAKKVGDSVEITNSIDMKLSLIPSGAFLMGSTDDESGREAHEGPRHEVVLTRPFYMGVHDVTVGQYKAFVRDKGYKTAAETSGGVNRLANGVWRLDPQGNWLNPGFEQTDDNPVVGVTWNDAVAFCDWLSAKEDRHYALPTEAQWEYACRAGSQTKFFFGNDDQELSDYAWYTANSGMKSHPVGGKKPNAWGLYDMHGNVFNWTADWYAGDFYRKSPREDPTGPATGVTHVTHGGSWSDKPGTCRCAVRGYGTMAERYVTIGFRVVLLR